MLQNDIRKLQPPVPKNIRRDTTSPYATADSNRTTSSQEVNRQSSGIINPTTLKLHRSSKASLLTGHGSVNSGNCTSSPSSPIVYWSEFENPEQIPYTVEVDENAPLLPWLYRRQKQDLEARAADSEHPSSDSESFIKRTLQKIRGLVEFEVKTSADGLTTLFYEKGLFHDDDEEEDDSASDESSSDAITTRAIARRIQHRRHVRMLSDHEVSRTQLLNRGYCLCVVGCMLVICLLGSLGLMFNGDAAGIAFVLVGFLISMSLEIVSLVRFTMYIPLPLLSSPLFRDVADEPVGKVVIPGLRGSALLSLRW